MQAAVFIRVVAWFALAAQPEAATVESVQGVLQPGAQVQVPALQEGLVLECAVRLGDRVQKGQLVARLDGSQARFAKDAAEVRVRMAKEEAQDDTPVAYAEAALDVIRAELRTAEESNARVEGSVPDRELRQLTLATRQAERDAREARRRQQMAELELRLRQVELDAAANRLARCEVMAPIDGVVAKVYRQGGEWARAGEPLVAIVVIDRLRVEAGVDYQRVAGRDLSGKPVTVTVGGRQSSAVKGTVVAVSPVVDTADTVRVVAEIPNQKADGQWLFAPGQQCKLSIPLE